MNTKDKCDCKYCKDLFIEKAISVQKPDVTKKLNDTIQNGIISRNECMYPEDYQKEILDSCWDTSQRWAKAVDHLIDDNLQIPGKTIKKGIISDIFSITDLHEREIFVNHEFGEDSISDDEDRTIYERYFRNKTLENFSLSRQALGDMASKCYGGGKFTRNVIDQWRGGSVPYDRVKVIKLAFWAKCTLEETNKLLECAGMHKLYLKGTSSSATLQNSLQDMVYIFMLGHKCYSFATAQEFIDKLDYHLLITAQLEIDSEKNKETSEDVSTTSLLYELNNLNFEQSSFIEYFKKYVPHFISSYNMLNGNLAILFTDKYCICKNNQLDASQNSIRALTNSALRFSAKTNGTHSTPKGEIDKWPSSLSNLLYAAFGIVKRPKKQKKNSKKQETAPEPIHKHMERIFSRNDIITMGLILNCSKAGINNLLNLAQEPPLYARNFIENIVMTASDNTTGYICEVSSQDLIDQFTSVYSNCYGITKQDFSEAISAFQRFSNYPSKYDKEYMDFTDAITAMKSLRRYGWIRSISVAAVIYPTKSFDILQFKPLAGADNESLKRILTSTDKAVRKSRPNPESNACQNLFVIKVNFRYVIKNQRRKTKKPLEPAEKTICLKKLQIVRPMSFRYSKELLSLYPENVMFDFLVRKTSFYLKDNDFRKYLI